MLPLFDRDGRFPAVLRDALDRGALLVTANERAARALVGLYGEDQRGLGLRAWPAPRILSWSAWIAELWEEHARWEDDAPLVLSALAEQQLWKRVQGEDRDRVVAPERMAALAAEAWELLGRYSAHPLRRRAAAGSLFAEVHEDAQRFLAWAGTFERICRENGWIARADQEGMLASPTNRLTAPGELFLIGFDRTLPSQAALLEAFEARGTVLIRYEQPHSSAAPLLVEARDETEELRACAAWCRAQLAESPRQRIALIAPEPQALREQLDRTLRRTLRPEPCPALTASGARVEEHKLPFEFSLGTPLASQGLVRSALLLLRLAGGALQVHELTALLTSGFLAASEEELLWMAKGDAALRGRRDGGPRSTLGWLLGRRELPASLRRRLSKLERLDLEAVRRAPWARWAELAAQLTEDAGWPGFRSLDTVSFQARRRWERLLGEVAELGFDGTRPSWDEFLSVLEGAAAATVFAPESTGASIQIMGAFESSGQSFDAVWLLGADDERWPAVGRPHPLLPHALQREAGMPHATPAADTALGAEATGRILASAPVVAVSYTRLRGASELRPSPLLPPRGACVVESAASLLARLPAVVEPRPIPLETLLDDSGAVPWPREQTAGGTEVLKRQSACAMQSFATRRLEARPLEGAEPGLDARERGTLMHAVLQSLWSGAVAGAFRTHAELEEAFANGSVAATVTEHIAAAFTPAVESAGGDPWRLAYLEVEQIRVRERVLEWLACERGRQPFRVAEVEGAEARPLTVGALTLRGRPDRIDALADGTHLLLDYKTGRVDSRDWESERPREPQLPLYAIFGGVERVSAVAFAQIRAGETKLVARAEDPAGQVSRGLGALTERNRFDDEVRDGWSEALLGLASDFLEGVAAVDPQDGAKTCRWCPLAGLCRVHAEGLLDEPEEGEDDLGDE